MTNLFEEHQDPGIAEVERGRRKNGDLAMGRSRLCRASGRLYKGFLLLEVKGIGEL